MNKRIARLLGDYFRRTFGVWVLLVLAQLLQTSVFWAASMNRVPLVGAVIASLLYFATFDSPQTVLRTLPLSRVDVALSRWWASIGAPALVILTCTLISVVTNSEHGWPVPAIPTILETAGLLLSALGWLAILPLPVLSPSGQRRSWFALVWGALVVTAVYGAPLAELTRWLPILLMITGILVSGISFARARRGLLTGARGQGDVAADRSSYTQATAAPEGRTSLHGWPVLALEVARSTAWLSIVALIATWILRICVSPWFFGAFEPALVWVFASATAVAACFLTRRWMLTVRSMRMLPIGDHRLAALLYLILITPGIVTCLVVMAAGQLSPGWGLQVPSYILGVFMLTPAALVPWQRPTAAAPAAAAIQQWSPVIQLAAFPLWAGAMCAFRGPHLQPAWFQGFLVLFCVAACIAGYAALLAGIRSPQGFETYGGPLGSPL